MTQEIGEDTSAPSVAQTPPKSIGFVIDDEIVDVLYTDERMSAILLSNPIIIDLSNVITNAPDTSTYRPTIGWTYNADQNAVIGMDGENNPIVLNLSN
jgi:hypothetical protein